MYPQAQPSRNATPQEIFVTAAETEGDKYASPVNFQRAPSNLISPVIVVASTSGRGA